MVETRTWDDPWFRAANSDVRVLWLYLLTGPRRNPIPGVVIARPGVVADDLAWSAERLWEVIKSGWPHLECDDSHCRTKQFSWDIATGLLLLTRALIDRSGKARSSSRPRNPNMLKRWGRCFDAVPPCELKSQLYDQLKQLASVLGGAFERAFADAFTEPTEAVCEIKTEQKNLVPQTNPEQKKSVHRIRTRDYGLGTRDYGLGTTPPANAGGSRGAPSAPGLFGPEHTPAENPRAKRQAERERAAAVAAEVVAVFNRAFSRRLEHSSWVDHVRRLLEAGYTADAMRGVVWWAANYWPPHVRANTTPKALLRLKSTQGRGTFPEHLAQASEAWRDEFRDDPPWESA